MTYAKINAFPEQDVNIDAAGRRIGIERETSFLQMKITKSNNSSSGLRIVHATKFT